MDTTPHMSAGQRLKAALFGMTILTLGMGIGRFLFTALLPVMIGENRFTFSQLSYIASANYAGYLFGSLLFSFSRLGRTSHPALMLFIGAAATGVLIFAMAPDLPVMLAVVIRFLAGIASAAAMIFGSMLVLQHTHDSRVIASLYAGVGVGILLGNEYVIIGLKQGLTASGLWWGAGLLSVALLLLLWLLYPRQADSAARHTTPPPADQAMSWWQLATLYGLAGFGYIIVATYLPLMVKTQGASLLAAHLWSLVGLSVVPGCFFWLWAARRWGTLPCLSANLLVQGGCVLLTLFSDSPLLLIISGLGFGATFMGTTSLVMPLARRLHAPHSINMLGLVTLTYGVGQIIGPLLTSALQASSHAVSMAIVCGAVALFAAAAISQLNHLVRQKSAPSSP
ncbi:MFS transporter [Dickeya fangzhongdai]|nr:MFS transporter [Dickeya fangzhongdai]